MGSSNAIIAKLSWLVRNAGITRAWMKFTSRFSKLRAKSRKQTKNRTCLRKRMSSKNLPIRKWTKSWKYMRTSRKSWMNSSGRLMIRFLKFRVQCTCNLVRISKDKSRKFCSHSPYPSAMRATCSRPSRHGHALSSWLLTRYWRSRICSSTRA